MSTPESSSGIHWVVFTGWYSLGGIHWVVFTGKFPKLHLPTRHIQTLRKLHDKLFNSLSIKKTKCLLQPPSNVSFYHIYAWYYIFYTRGYISSVTPVGSRPT